jgi:hypothetical protein
MGALGTQAKRWQILTTDSSEGFQLSYLLIKTGSFK